MVTTHRLTAIPSDAPGTAALRWRSPALLVALVLLLWIPTLFEPPWFGDEGIFMAVAQRLVAGEALYADAWDNKPPLVYLIYAAVYATAGPSVVLLRLIGAAIAVGTTLTVLAIGRRVIGGHAAIVAAAVYAVSASTPFLQGTLLLTEVLAALPAALAVLVVLAATDASAGRPASDRGLLSAGALLGVAFCAKQVAVFDAAAVGAWLLLRPGRPLRDVALLIAGWTAPVLLAGAWLVAQGAVVDAWLALFWGYRAYLGERAILPRWVPLLTLMPAMASILWTAWGRRRGGPAKTDLLLTWFGFALAAALLPGRPYGHYLVQALAPAALLVGLAVGRGGARMRTVAAAALAFGLWLTVNLFWPYWFSHGTLRPAYYANWLTYMTGGKDRAAYERFFDWRVANHRALAEQVRSGDGERTLFVWGEYPWAYPLADATNPTRFATSYHTFLAEGAKTETLRALEDHPPRYIAQEVEEWRRLPGLDALLAERYEPVSRIDNIILWERQE